MAPLSVLSVCLGGVVILAGVVLPIIWMILKSKKTFLRQE